MTMWTIIIKNPGGSVVKVANLGLPIAGGGQVDLSDWSYAQISSSDDLRGLVQAGTLVVNDGTEDLSAANGVAFLSLVHRQYLAENYYNKAELNQAGGGGVVHWDNIAGKPTYGQPDGWYRPVAYQVLAVNASTAPASPSIGNVYVDNTAQYLKWNGASWDPEGTAAAGDRVIDLSDGDKSILQWSGTLWEDQGAPSDNFAIIVDDDGDGKGAQYIYSSSVPEWAKIGDLDWADHFNGGAGKHDASEVDVEGSYSNIPGTPSNLESAINAIDTKFGVVDAAIQAKSLDSAYDAGNTINADAGPVKINPTSTNAPLELTPKTDRSTTGLAPGQIEVGTDGLPYIYDGTRSKWLSIQRFNLVFGKDGPAKDIWLPFGVGTLASSNGGYRMMRKATITGMSCQLSSSGTCNIHCQKNGAEVNIASLSLSSENGNQRTDLNEDLNAGDFLQNYLESTSKVNDPVVIVEYAWRG